MRSPLPWLVLSCCLRFIVAAARGASPGQCQDKHCDLDAACFVQSAFSYHSRTSAGEFLDGSNTTVPLAHFGEELECKRSPVQQTRLFKSGSFEHKRNFEFLIGRENIQPWPQKSLRGLYLWDYFVPEVACPNVDRIGRIGDGGKWVCDVEVLAKRGGSTPGASGRSSPCSIFSYGVGWDVSFELELLQAAPACSVHLFDPTVGRLPQEVQPYMYGGTWSNISSGARPPVSFHKVGLASTSGGIAASGSADFPLVESLVDGMQRVGVDFIDVLKVDVEGAEYASLLPLLQQRRPGVDPPLFGQLLIELHATEGEEKATQGTSAHDIFELIDLLGKHGYRIFSKELNLGPTVEGRPPIGIEYSLIHPEAWSNASCSRSLTMRPVAGLADSRKQPDEHQGSGTPAPFGQFPRHVDGGGVIYFFTNAGRLSIFRETLKALHINFNWEYRYPVVVFHENITLAQQRVLQQEVPGQLYKLRFIDLLKEQAGMVLPPTPSSMPLACGSSQQAANEAEARGLQKSTFHAFLAPELLHQRFGYSWAWHLDDDTQIQAPIGYDPFQLMAVNGWRYGATATVANAVECMAGLWDLATKFAANHSQDLGHGVHFLRQLAPGMAFSEGFELSHESLWTSKIYTQWRKEVLQYWVSSGRTAAWGDAAAASLRAIGVAMALHPSEVHRFVDVGFRHALMEQQAQGLSSAGAPTSDGRAALTSAEELLNALPWVGSPLPQQAQYVTIPDLASSKPARLLEVLPAAASQRTEGWAGLRLQPQRVANAQSAGWIGGDVGALVSLPPTEGAGMLEKRQQLLWLFRDTMLGTTRRGVPTHLEKVLRQSVGRSMQGLNSTSPLLFEWAADDGLQESGDLFPCATDRHTESSQCFYWPVAGVSVFDGVETDAKNVRLIVLANHMLRRQSSKEAEVLGSSVIVVKNPFEHASLWLWEVRDIPGDDISWCGGVSAIDGTFPSSADGHDDLIYITGRVGGREGSDAGAVVARIGAKDLLALRLHRLAVARRDSRGVASLWLPLGDEQLPATDLATIFTPAPTEFSLLWSHDLKAWLTAGLVEPEHGGHGMTLLTLRAAQAPEGPWGKPAVVGALLADSALGKCHAVKLFQADPSDTPDSGTSGATLLVSMVCRPLSTQHELPDRAVVPIIYRVPLKGSEY